MEGLAKLSLTLWVDRLKDDRVLAALIGCTTSSLPPLGSYFDFMDRLWGAPETGLYARNKLLQASWNSKRPDKPKEKNRKPRNQKLKSPNPSKNDSWTGKISLLTLRGRLQRFFYHTTVLPSLECGLIPGEHLTVSGDGTAVHTHASPRGHHRDGTPGADIKHYYSVINATMY